MKNKMTHYLLISCLISGTLSYANSDKGERTSSEQKNILAELTHITKILKKSNGGSCQSCCTAVQNCCNTLGNSISNVENTVNMCCSNLANDIANVNNNLTTCCNTLEDLIGNLTVCGGVTVIKQEDIPAVITRSGHYCIGQDLTVNTGIGITIKNATGVDLDLNGQTLSGKGGSSLIAVTGTSSLVHIHNGIVAGTGNSADVAQVGIAALANNILISTIQAQNFSATGSSGILIQGPVPGTVPGQLQGVSVEQYNSSNNYFGIQLSNSCTNVKLHNCSFDQSIFAAIAQPANGISASNILIDNCAISNSVNQGIYTASSQSNWVIKDVQVSNSGSNGFTLKGSFQSLAIKNCQLVNSGGYGIIVSTEQSKNVEINDCEFNNSQTGGLLINTVNNLLIQNCQFTNNSSNSQPLFTLQNAFNSSIRGCLFSSTSAVSDGFFATSCQGLSLQNCNANIICPQANASCPIGFNLNGGISNAALENCTVSGNPSNRNCTPPCRKHRYY